MTSVMRANLLAKYADGRLFNYRGGVYRAVKVIGDLSCLPGGSGVVELEIEAIRESVPQPLTQAELVALSAALPAIHYPRPRIEFLLTELHARHGDLGKLKVIDHEKRETLVALNKQLVTVPFTVSGDTLTYQGHACEI